MSDNWTNLLDILMNDDDQKLREIVPSQFGENTIFTQQIISSLCNSIAFSENHSLLTIAVSLNKIKCAKYLCSVGANINYQTSSGYSPLLYSISNGNIDLMIFLLQSKDINLNLYTNGGYFPIHLAALSENLQIMKFLLNQHLYDPNLFTKNENATTPLILALENGNYETARILLANSAKPDLPSTNKTYPLHAAIKGSNINLIIDLFQFPIDKNCKNEQGCTPLLLACVLRKYDIMRYLLMHPDVDVNATTNDSDNILFYSTEKSFLLNDILLLDLVNNPRFNFNYQNKFGDTFLHAVVANSYMEASFYIPDFIAKIDPNIKNNKGITALDIAVFKHDYLAIVNLLNRPNIEVTEYAKRSNILIFAISQQKTDVAQLLIQKGFDVDQMDDAQTTPLMMATIKGNISIIKQLIATRRIDINKCNSAKQNAFLIASMIRGGENMLSLMLNHPLLDPNWENEEGETALLNSITYNNPKSAGVLLLNKRVNPNYLSKKNVYPFLAAVKSANLSIITSFLTNESTNLSITDDENSNAIHYAILSRSADVLSLLHDYDIDMMHKNNNNLTPIEFAILLQNFDLAACLSFFILPKLAFIEEKTPEHQRQYDLCMSVRTFAQNKMNDMLPNDFEEEEEYNM